MVLPAQTIRKLNIITPFSERTQHKCGASFGLSACGYDVRLDQDLLLYPESFILASTLEHFAMPNDVMGVVHDKSTWARKGISVQNTVIEPGWRGFLTLELTLARVSYPILFKAGYPIAQIVFLRLEEITEQPYDGKYQNQKRGPQEAIL